MKHGTLFHIGSIFFVLQIAAMACSTFRAAEYAKYSPLDPVFNKITFEYPDTWTWEVYSGASSANSGYMHADDPDASAETLLGAVRVRIVFFESQAEAKLSMEKQIADQLNTMILNKAEITSNQEFELDGYLARQIVLRQGLNILTEGPVHGPSISEYIYVLVGNSYYTISISTADGNRDGEFGQGFDHMIETIRFLP